MVPFLTAARFGGRVEPLTPRMQREIAIRGEMIRLGQLLKLAGVVDSGAEIKPFLAAQSVLVNGDGETRRGRQLPPR
jgi:ribosome-associated protein